MSEQMIARWSVCPFEAPSAPSNLKRPRPEEESDDDDISHSPSPASQNEMDVDEVSIQNYVRKSAREVITVDTKIKPSNKGFALLTKLGWHEGQPVGLSTEGRTEPVPFYIKSDLTGLEKTNLDFQMIEMPVSQRRQLHSEMQRHETEEQRKVREDFVAPALALEAEIPSTLKSFYCELCDKQFQTVAQYNEHKNSYAHHLKARSKTMQANNRKKPEELDKRKGKELKYEEKESCKVAATNGVKLPKAQISALPQIDLSNNIDADAIPTEIPENNRSWPTPSSPINVPPGSSKSGWTTISTPQPASNLIFEPSSGSSLQIRAT